MINTTINGYKVCGNFLNHPRTTITLPEPVNGILTEMGVRKGIQPSNLIRQWVFDAIERETGINLLKIQEPQQTPTTP